MIERLSISRERGAAVVSLSLSLSFSLYLFSNTEPAVSSFVSKSRHSFFMRLRDPRHRSGQRKTDRACSKRKRKRHCCSCQSIERLFPFFVLGRKFSSPRVKGETKDKLQRQPSRDPSHLSIGNWSNEPDQIQRIPTRGLLARILLSFSTIVLTLEASNSSRHLKDPGDFYFYNQWKICFRLKTLMCNVFRYKVRTHFSSTTYIKSFTTCFINFEINFHRYQSVIFFILIDSKKS